MLMADGQPPKGAARILRISHRTAQSHLAAARAKHGCRTTYQLIARFIKEGAP